MEEIASLLRLRNLQQEATISATRSSGPGGQHVNKVSTRVELRFNIIESAILTAEEKELLMQKLDGKITKEGDLIVISQEERSQFDNKERAIEKFYQMLAKALKKPRKRKPTRPTAASRVKRMETKIHQSQKKVSRKPKFEE